MMDLDKIKRFFTGRSAQRKTVWFRPLALDHGAIGEACLGLDAQGQGIVIWSKDDTLWLTLIGSGGGPALAGWPLGEGRQPRMAINSKGRGVVLWLDGPSECPQIVGASLDVKKGAGERHCIWSGAGRIHDLQIAVDRRGGAQAVWAVEKGTRWEIFVMAFDPRSEHWEAQPRRLGSSSESPLSPTLAMNHKGQATVLWQDQLDGFKGILACHHWTAEKLWSDHPMPAVPTTASELAAAIDEVGNLQLVWIEHGEHHQSRLLTSRFPVATSVWETPRMLARSGSLRQLRMAKDGRGDSLIAWQQSDQAGDLRFLTRCFRGLAWEESVENLNPGLGPLQDFALAKTPGHGVALLLPTSGNPMVRHFAANWEAPMSLMVDGQNVGLNSPMAALSPQGAFALWQCGWGSEKTLYVVEGDLA